MIEVRPDAVVLYLRDGAIRVWIYYGRDTGRSLEQAKREAEKMMKEREG